MKHPGSRAAARPSVEQVLDALVVVARPYILQFAKRTSCILTSTTVLDVLRAFDIAAQPLTVQVVVYNLAFMERWQLSGAPARDVREADCWWAESRAWHLGVGMGQDRPGKWAGHLVVTVPRRDQQSTMLDLSIDMASRPKRNMVVTPLKTVVPQTFVQGSERWIAFSGNTTLLYEARPEDTGYTVSPNWQNQAERRRHSIAVLALVHQHLAAQADKRRRW